MKPAAPTVVFAVRTAKGERRRIRSFLRQIQELGVELEDLPSTSVRALNEADRFLGRYLDLLARETPNAEQLEGVMEALGGIDRVVKNAMGEVLKSLGWRPEKPEKPAVKPPKGSPESSAAAPDRKGKAIRAPQSGSAGAGGEKPLGKVIQFPGPRSRKPVS